MLAALALPLTFISAQNFDYKWQRVHMDSTYESSTIYKVDSIVASHQEQMAPLMQVVIYAEEEIEKGGKAESPLANLAADMLLYAAKDYTGNGYPTMSLTNLGGIRSNFPKGAVRVYDIYSTFPFNNYVVVAVLKGEDIRDILEGFASKDRFEALGGVSIVVEDKKLKKCLIGGQPLEDDALYNLVTIDFLLDGGDRFDIGKEAVSVERTGIVMRDATVKYLDSLYKAGKVLRNEGDGRVIIEKD